MKLISTAMVNFVLNGKRNLSVAKAKIVAKKTKTDPMVWIDPAGAPLRRAAWEKAFPKKERKE